MTLHPSTSATGASGASNRSLTVGPRTTVATARTANPTTRDREPVDQEGHEAPHERGARAFHPRFTGLVHAAA